MLHQSGFMTKNSHRSILSRLATVLLLSCVGSLLLTACGETGNEEDRRFANDPSRDPQPTQVVRETEVPEATPTMRALPPPETLLRARGAPSTVYAILNGNIHSIQLNGGKATTGTIAPPDGARFVAINSSPSGDRVAAVTTSASGTTSAPTVDLIVFDRDGKMLETWNAIVAPEMSGSTPVAGATSTSAAEIDLMVDWGAQGNRIVVASPGGQIAIAALGGEAAPIQTPAGVASIRDVEWSPRGDTIALLTAGNDDLTRIGLIDPSVASPEFQVVVPVDDSAEDGQIRSFSWLPDGSGLVYLTGSGDYTDAAGGQLFSVNLETKEQRLVATAGQGGPSATIVDFSISPDGKAVAYTIMLPDAGVWRFNSLWVRSLRDQRAIRLPVGDVIEVNAIWWIDRGMLWGQAGSDGEQIRELFVRLTPGGDPTAILAVEVATGASQQDGTPVASPEATPGAATPVGT